MYHFYRSFFETAMLRRARLLQRCRRSAEVRQVDSGMSFQPEKAPNASGVRFVRLPNAAAVGRQAARMVAEQIVAKPDAALVFPTGKTPLPMYAALREIPELDWSQCRLFQLDEYLPPASGTTDAYETFADFMNRELWGHISGQKYYIQDYLAKPEQYESLLSRNGGPDLVLLGIGGNGHIAFNEPGSLPDSRMRVVDLAEETITSNFGPMESPDAHHHFPSQAMTLGLCTILQARQLVLLATGLGKRDIIRRAFSPAEPPALDCPASWLKRHSHITVITDFEVG